METKLNTTISKFEKPEEYWQDLNRFREQNKDECVSSKQVNFDGTTSSLFLDSSNMRHACGGGGGEDDNAELEDGRNHRCMVILYIYGAVYIIWWDQAKKI